MGASQPKNEMGLHVSEPTGNYQQQLSDKIIFLYSSSHVGVTRAV